MRSCPRCEDEHPRKKPNPASDNGVCVMCKQAQIKARDDHKLRQLTVPEIDDIMVDAARVQKWSLFEACNDELRDRNVPPAP